MYDRPSPWHLIRWHTDLQEAADDPFFPTLEPKGDTYHAVIEPGERVQYIWSMLQVHHLVDHRLHNSYMMKEPLRGYLTITNRRVIWLRVNTRTEFERLVAAEEQEAIADWRTYKKKRRRALAATPFLLAAAAVLDPGEVISEVVIEAATGLMSRRKSRAAAQTPTPEGIEETARTGMRTVVEAFLDGLIESYFVGGCLRYEHVSDLGFFTDASGRATSVIVGGKLKGTNGILPSTLEVQLKLSDEHTRPFMAQDVMSYFKANLIGGHLRLVEGSNREQTRAEWASIPYTAMTKKPGMVVTVPLALAHQKDSLLPQWWDEYMDGQ